MNKKELKEIFRKIDPSIKLDETELNDIKINIEGSCERDIVFYKLGNDERSKERLRGRLEHGSPGILVTNRRYEHKRNIVVPEEEFLSLQKRILDVIYPASGKMKIIGVTGTNGKTTVVSLASQIMSRLGEKCVSVGTIGVFAENQEVYPSPEMTTPSYIDIRKIINALEQKYEYMFLEVSSHALDQNRLYDLKLAAAGFTNLTQDHLDYHGNMENYFEAKCKIVNILEDGAFLFIPREEKELFQKVSTIVNKKEQIKKTLALKEEVPPIMSFGVNRKNLELAVAMIRSLKNEEKLNLKDLKLPEGRSETVVGKGKTVIVDYAHTPDALESICKSIKEIYPDKGLAILFGCGGDRDRNKRPLMGEAAEKYADRIILTSDNPRSEEPMEIINQVVAGIKNMKPIIIEDRERAIISAIEDLKKDKEVLVVAGKGHEKYQEIAGVKRPFSDKKIIEKVLND